MDQQEGSPLVSIVVCVWNKVELTAGFLNSLWPWVKRSDAEIVVVDDGSTDNTPRMLKKWGERAPKAWKFRSYHFEENRGFGPANNYGVGVADGQYLILINNDVEIRGNFIKNVMDALLLRPDAIVCGKLIDWDSGWNTFNGGELRVVYAEGWLLGFHRDTWERLGGFDERYVPCDFEDVDLSMKARQQEISLVQIRVPLIHRSGATTRQLRNREEITIHNRRLFMEKWGLKP